MNENMDRDRMINPGRGLVDLIAGVTPTYVGWDNDPTDGANITDGDTTTACTTGDGAKLAGVGIEMRWELGGLYTVNIGFIGTSTATAGTPYVDMYLYNGVNSVTTRSSISAGVLCVGTSLTAQCSRIALVLVSTADATLAPNIREVTAWKLR